MERLVGHYRTLLEAACAEPDSPVARLLLLTRPELDKLRGVTILLRGITFGEPRWQPR